MRTKTTLNLDTQLVRRVRVRAARLGKSDTDIYEEALHRGLSAIDELRRQAATVENDEMYSLVDSVVHDLRARRRSEAAREKEPTATQ